MPVTFDEVRAEIPSEETPSDTETPAAPVKTPDDLQFKKILGAIERTIRRKRRLETD
jgi:hypothetical protein